MASAELRDQIASSFGSVSDELAERIVKLSDLYHKSIDDLYVSWESFAVTKLDAGEFNETNVDKFQQYLQESTVQKFSTPHRHNKKRVLKTVASSSPAPGEVTPLKRAKLTPYKTPKANFGSSPNYETADSSYAEPYSSPTRKSQTPNSNTIIETLNPDVDSIDHGSEDRTQRNHKIVANYEPQKYKYRTMAMKVLEAADYLDDQIEMFANEYIRVNGVTTENENRSTEFGNPCIASQTDILCCGRIVPDSTAYDSKAALNDVSLCLETSRTQGIGQRIPLDISNLSSYSFFAGQIVVLKGRNPTGRRFVVSEELELPSLGTLYSTAEELNSYNEQVKDGLKVVMASGPFSPIQHLDFTKFSEFIHHVNTEIRPDVVVLTGPFIDVANYAVRDGKVEHDDGQNFADDDQLFIQKFVPLIKQFDQVIDVILVPSIKDVVMRHVAYPQDSFDKKKYGLPKNVKVMPNPANISLNEMSMGISNLDVFKDLVDVSKGSTSNRLERITRHIIQQRRYYPVFPGSVDQPRPNDPIDGLLEGGAHGQLLAQTNVGGSCLELSYMGLAELGTNVPDVLLLPSQVTPIAKIIDGIVTINPGQFIRPHRDSSKQSGSYVVMSVQPPRIGDNVQLVEGMEDAYRRCLPQRCRVDILRS
ncbi:hypothetical protein DIURU_005661 [Diutina rugosa]|uniref:DNA polymerase alpha subunit B n=1 Tax=Diutina rugosa TaxID=5481 RepID=A0A642UGI6_DIURU|nr:uncharacterized protein DIURU_005661 [Diutina rugosa]KAA8896649.1 hypothetical protein DIURU_005661 [Diutina rugosa]